MRKVSILTITAILASLLSFGNTQAASGNLTAAINKMKKRVYQPLRKWQMTDTLSEEKIMDPNTSAKKFRRVGIGHFWSGGERTIWLRNKYKVPEKILNLPVEGSKITMSANIEDWGEIYVNGEMKQKFRRSSGYIVLTENAKPGDKYFIVIKATRKARDAGLIRDIKLNYSVLAEIERRVMGISESIGSLDALLKLSGEDPEKWTALLNEAAGAIDLDALENGRPDEFFASLDRCKEVLAPVTSIVKQYSMLLMGYSHIDPAWLWDKAEGEHIVVKGTSEQILGLMEDFPDFIYVANQMHCYRWMEDDYPELFEKIKERIKEGRWEPTGAEWVEPDGNLAHGESYVRQFMYGRKYSKEKFGFVSTVGLTPDSFGYNWSMPQILAKSDMRGFITQKISWNDTTRFPHNLFWWESPDGSRILVYFPQGSYGESVRGDTMASQLARMKEKHGVDSNLVIYGVGDHGGGIPRDYLERATALRGDPLYPKIEFVNGEMLFDRVHEDAKTIDFPVWNDELYLEYHRGTYTTQSNTKNNNRRNEHCLMNAEKFSTIAALEAGTEYAFDKIEEAWKILLFNQFHDILPGSSITPVYKDADADYAWIAGECAEAKGGALGSLAALADTSGDGQALILFNGLSWARDDVVEVELGDGVTEAAVIDDSGKEIPAQTVINKDGKMAALFVARNLPPMGFAVYRLLEGKASSATGGTLSVSDHTLENDYFEVKIDPATGWVSNIIDKKNDKREAIASGKAAFQLQAYKETDASDAWDMRFPSGGGLMEMPDAEEISVAENGPVRVTIMARRKFGEKDEFRQYYSLVEGVPIVYGRLDADWYDDSVFLKSAFNLNLDSDIATFEIPYTTIDRVAKPKTAAERAKWEMSGHRWVDYTDSSGEYGVTLLSFSKYGYDVKDNVLRMTMLRSPNRPDPEADRGRHSIPYALYPHAGGWQDADSQLRGREYNDPVIIVKAENHTGKLGKSHSFFAAGPDNVVVTTIKKAEDGEGFVMRLLETEGRDGEAVIELPAAPKRVVETNLVERDLNELPTPGGKTLTVPIGHYEIKSLKLVF